MNVSSTNSLSSWQRLEGWVERRPRAAMGLIVLLAIVLRVGAIFYAAPPDRVYGTELVNVAQGILSGRGMADAYGAGSGPTAHASPVYPLILAGVYSVFGFGYWGAVAQLTFGLLQAVGIFFLLLPLCEACALPLFSGLLGGLFFAIPLSSFSERGNWEAPLVALTILVGIILAIDLQRRNTWRDREAWAAGIFCGAAILISPALAPWFGLLALVGIVSNRRGIARFLLIGGIAVALTLSPWVIRNYLALGAPIWSRSNFGLEFHLSHNDQSRAEFEDFYDSGASGAMHPSGSDEERRKVSKMGEVAYNREKLHEGLRWAVTHPRREMALLAARIFHFWFPTLHWRVQTAIAWMLTLLGLVGLVMWIRAGRAGVWVVGALFLTYPSIYYLNQTNNRHTYPLIPVVMVFAGDLARRTIAGWAASRPRQAARARAASA